MLGEDGWLVIWKVMTISIIILAQDWLQSEKEKGPFLSYALYIQRSAWGWLTWFPICLFTIGCRWPWTPSICLIKPTLSQTIIPALPGRKTFPDSSSTCRSCHRLPPHALLQLTFCLSLTLPSSDFTQNMQRLFFFIKYDIKKKG